MIELRCNLRGFCASQFIQDSAWSRRSRRQVSYVSYVGEHDRPVYTPDRDQLRGVRRHGNHSLRTLADVREFPGRHGRKAARPNARPLSEQQRQLRVIKLPLGFSLAAIEQSEVVRADRVSRPQAESHAVVPRTRTQVQRGSEPNQSRLVRAARNRSTRSIQIDSFRATSGRYTGHFSHAASAGLYQQFHRDFPWLRRALIRSRFDYRSEGKAISIHRGPA